MATGTATKQVTDLEGVGKVSPVKKDFSGITRPDLKHGETQTGAAQRTERTSLADEITFDRNKIPSGVDVAKRVNDLVAYAKGQADLGPLLPELVNLQNRLSEAFKGESQAVSAETAQAVWKAVSAFSTQLDSAKARHQGSQAAGKTDQFYSDVKEAARTLNSSVASATATQSPASDALTAGTTAAQTENSVAKIPYSQYSTIPTVPKDAASHLGSAVEAGFKKARGIIENSNLSKQQKEHMYQALENAGLDHLSTLALVRGELSTQDRKQLSAIQSRYSFGLPELANQAIAKIKQHGKDANAQQTILNIYDETVRAINESSDELLARVSRLPAGSGRVGGAGRGGARGREASAVARVAGGAAVTLTDEQLNRLADNLVRGEEEKTTHKQIMNSYQEKQRELSTDRQANANERQRRQWFNPLSWFEYTGRSFGNGANGWGRGLRSIAGGIQAIARIAGR
jgi:hypothetical protein